MDRPASHVEWARTRLPAWTAAVVVAGTLLWLAFDQGGYFEDRRLTAAVVLWVTLAVLALVELPRLRLSTPALIAIGALVLFTAWTALSTGWTSDAPRGERLVDLDLLYVAIFGLGLLIVGNGRNARVVLLGALAVGTAVMAAALWARLHPGTFGSPPADAQPRGFRMEWPFGYWNALGGLGGMTAVLAVGLAADPRSRILVRAVASGAAVVCLVAAYMTFSRGSIVAVAAGVVALLALGVHRSSLVASLVAIGAGTAVLVARLESVPALTTDPTAGHGIARAGEVFTPFLVAVVLAVAAGQATLAAGDRSVALTDLLRRARRPVAIGAAALLAVTAFGAYVVRADAIEGRTATALEDTGDWISRQWDEFNRPGVPLPAAEGSARLDSAGGTRADLWSVAWDSFLDHPLRGAGAGSYQVRFFQDRTVDENVQNAHSIEYETLGELGLVGMALLLTFLGGIAGAVVRSRRRRLSLPTTQTAAAGAAVVVWLVHASVDWDWQMPAFTGLALVIAAPLFPRGRRGRRRRRRRYGAATAGP